jgi:hypothetical protein
MSWPTEISESVAGALLGLSPGELRAYVESNKIPCRLSYRGKLRFDAATVRELVRGAV